jgi:hypothetical protein
MVKQPSQPPPAPPTDEAAPPPNDRQTRAKGPTAAELGEQIGHRLREMFNDVVTDPVPEKFHQLLEELDRRSSKTGR